MIIPKNPNEKKFDFWTKTMDYLLRKMSIFLAPFKTCIFWSKIFLFCQEYRKKKFFSDLITPKKNQMKRNSIFGQKPWIIPLGKRLFLSTF